MADIDRNAAGAWPRWINILAGVWLFISAWAWPHTMPAQTNTWIVGVLVVIAGVWALFAPSVRIINTILSIWLFFSTLFIYHTNAGTVWNNLIVAIVVFVLSLIPSASTTWTGRGTEVPAT